MFVGDFQNDEIYEYTLSTPWDVTTKSFIASASFSGSSERSIYLKPDGTRLYSNNVITTTSSLYEYTLSTPWDVTTLTFSQSKDLSQYGSSERGLFIKPDGTKLYTVSLFPSRINEYNLSTPYSISTLSFNQSASLSTNPFDVGFSSNGEKIYILNTNDTISKGYLSTPYDISTIGVIETSNTLNPYSTAPLGLFLKPEIDPSSIFVADVVNDSIIEYNVKSNPKTIEFRFKAEEFPPTNLSQSLFSAYTNSNLLSDLTLEYTGSGLTSGSYSGSIKDPYYQYAYLKFYPSASNTSLTSSIYLPFFNGDWWSVMINFSNPDNPTNTIYAANKIYNGKDGTSIGYLSSSSIDYNFTSSNFNSYYFSTSSLFPGFSGSLQEIRYYKNNLSESVFKDYTMNPLSIEGNSINSSPNELAFRASLGSELDISTSLTQSSIHPKVTGSWVTTSSFTFDSNYYFNSTPKFETNTEYYFLDQFPAGIKNRITDKVRYEDNVVPTGDTLSAFRRVTQQTEASASYTENINLLEVAFSPQNEINDDIISQLGYFNMGDYIGDPRQRSSSLEYYPDLNNLSEEYFKKYIKNYDLVDFVRLIKFFDNSLFKMIKDFVPARTSLASGIVIKQHLLERNKYPQPQVSYEDTIYTGSITVGDIEGGAGGMFNIFNNTTTSPSGSQGLGPNNEFNVTQSWSETTTNLSGSATKVYDSQKEFYDGEFSGSCMLITNGELNEECEPFKNLKILIHKEQIMV
jgi:hypothetical protein